MKSLFLSLLLWIPILGHCVNITQEDAAVLNLFFQQMIKKSEGGYVIFDAKPVCTNGYDIEDFFQEENDYHREQVILKEGAETWRRLKLKDYNKDIIVHVYQQPDARVKNCIHILFINKPLFLETVRKNLSLFQYVLGPKTTPELLLKKLTDETETFHGVLKNDCVLIGILLGFGTQNSIHCTRIEKLEESIFMPESPPFKSIVSKLDQMNPMYLEMLITHGSHSEANLNSFQPTFGFSNISDEYKGLLEEVEVSSEKLCYETPQFIFGRVRGDQESIEIIQSLEKAQKMTQKLIQSETFFCDVLKFVMPDEPIHLFETSRINSLSFTANELKQLPHLVAANIWKGIFEEEPAFRRSFYKGMEASQRKLQVAIEDTDDWIGYDKQKALRKIENNRQNSHAFFQQLSHNSDYRAIVGSEIYYKTLEEGEGSEIENPSEIKAHYTIKDPSGKILADTWSSGNSVILDLNETIPGLSLGIKKMKINEIRELIIHPGMAYGLFTTLDKEIYLNVKIQLLEVISENEVNTTPFKIDFNQTIDLSLMNETEFQTLQSNLAFKQGFAVWEHYKNSNAFTYEQIIDSITKFEEGLDSDISKANQQALLNRLHWNLYQN